MGSSCSRESAGAVDSDATTPPPSSNRSTPATANRASHPQRSVLQSTDADTGGASAGGGLLSRLRRSHPSELSRQQERELREIEQLQFELAAMEALFQSMLGQAFREMADPEGGEVGGAATGGAPPASDQAVRRLPSVRVAAEDLVEETNRECIICYVENHINDRVVRLPCGHLFHRDCIRQWLVKRCTCPVCRYELPTDDPHYERGRVERMNARRPRMRRYELERMHARELRELAFARLGLSDRHDVLTDKADLIDRIVQSGKVDIIASPEPIEYKLSDLRSMGVTSLRHTMTDAGVIFDPVEVVEKEDMVQMFIESGRVMILPEEKPGREGGPLSKSAPGTEDDTDKFGSSLSKSVGSSTTCSHISKTPDVEGPIGAVGELPSTSSDGGGGSSGAHVMEEDICSHVSSPDEQIEDTQR